MIFVTVGTHTDGFPRLVRAMDRIAATLDEEVVMQIGATPYRPRSARWFTFASQAEIDALSEEARVIVSHAGAGSIMASLQHGKPMIVMPRLRKYREHLDDHQIELASALRRNGSLLVAIEAEELPRQLEAAASFVPRRGDSSGLVEALRRVLLEVGEGSGKAATRGELPAATRG